MSPLTSHFLQSHHHTFLPSSPQKGGFHLHTKTTPLLYNVHCSPEEEERPWRPSLCLLCRGAPCFCSLTVSTSWYLQWCQTLDPCQGHGVTAVMTSQHGSGCHPHHFPAAGFNQAQPLARERHGSGRNGHGGCCLLPFISAWRVRSIQMLPKEQQKLLNHLC